MSLRALARLTGISFGKISQLEHGYRARPDELLRLAAALDCDPSELVPGGGYA